MVFWQKNHLLWLRFAQKVLKSAAKAAKRGSYVRANAMVLTILCTRTSLILRTSESLATTMEKRKSIKISGMAHKVFTDISRQFQVGDREMQVLEMCDKLAAKKAELIKLLK